MAARSLISLQMATITFSEVGKLATEAEKSAVRFLFAHSPFELERNGSVDTDDPEVVAGAAAHPWLQVETKVASDAKTAEEQAAEVAASTDPHVNPKADHLSDVADPEVVAKADANAQAVREANAAVEPAVASPVVPEPAPAPAPAKTLFPEEHTQ